MYDFIASLRFAILILALIAVVSIFGTLIKQGASPEEYLARYPENIYRIISFLGLDDAYHTSWFYALIILFAVNLTLCTIRRLGRFRADKGTAGLPDEERLSAMDLHAYIQGQEMDEATNILKRRYKVTDQGDRGAVFEKGGLSRYGVLIIHASIIIILAGSFIGLLFGYRGFMTLSPGETKGTLVLRGKNPVEKPLGFALRCKDFRVNFYPTGEPKDFVSTVEIIDNGKAVLAKEIRVNDPLSYKGIRVYQSSYGNTPRFLFNIGGKNVHLAERETFRSGGLMLMVVRFESSIHDFGPGVLIAYLEGGEPKAAWFLKNISRLREQTLQGVTVRLVDIQEQLYTGLEVARDPGVFVVWTGFALILIGMYINFFLWYRRIYLLKVPDGLLLAGMATRNREDFKKEFKQLEEEIRGRTS